MKKIFYVSVSFLVALFAGVLPAFASSGPVWPYGLTVKTGNNPGTVWVMWKDDGATNKYNLTYGTDQKANMFGVVGLPFTKSMGNSFEVGQLGGGTTYYFSLVGETGGTPNMSGPVSAVAKEGTAVQAMVPATTTPAPAAAVSTSSGPVWPYGFMAATGATSGTVKLTWTADTTANKYDIVYGLMPGQYLWGAQGMSFTPIAMNSFTVRYLQSGVRYYFALVGEKDGATVSWGTPVSAVAW